VIGPNGSGKTTLLKLVLGKEKPDSGFIHRGKSLNIAYMPQEIDLDPDKLAFDSVRQGAREVLELEKELSHLETLFAKPEYYANEKRLAQLIDQQAQALEAYNQLGGSGLDGRIKALLTSIGFQPHEIYLPIGKLSGGQKKLVGLARIIISRPDVLLLDEPDNHLDLDSKTLLQKLIEDFPGSVLIVSHDRYFLDMVVDEIVEVDNGQITQFKGSYSEYIFEKKRQLEKQAQTFQTQQKEITRLEQAAKRLLMWGKVYDNAKFYKRGKNILNRIERMDKIDKPELEKDRIEIQFGGWRGSQKVLEINSLNKSFSDSQGTHHVLRNIDLLLRYGDRIGMIGANGVGKSLLIRLILGDIKAENGTIYIGPSVKTGYYAQEFETLDPKSTLLETICKAGNFSENRGVAFLKKFLFTYEQRDMCVDDLSGGERARLQIALITLSGANFLLLDEPTNHLDIPSCEVLEDALLDFDGTIFAVSHDRYFLDRIANRIVELHGNSTQDYSGNYSDYEQQKRISEKR
jgi:ATP-binding cassette subfamily F protein 3